MTFADPGVLEARSFLMSKGWPGASLGVVGDRAHAATGGYHCGNDWLSEAGRLNTDYSKRESGRDRPGSNAATAFDIGGVSADALYQISRWCVQQCQAGAPDTQDIREIIWYDKPSGVVRRWDRLGIRSTGDSSHTFHTHFSYFRDSEGRSKAPLFQRYYGAVTGGSDNMDPSNPHDSAVMFRVAAATSLTDTVGGGSVAGESNELGKAVKKIRDDVAAIKANQSAPAAVNVDASAVAAALASNTAFLSAVAKAVNDEAHARSAE